MKPARFEYRRPDDLASALELLAAGDDGCKLIAGGQSLGPMLNLRLARPRTLVDVSRLNALRRIEQTEDAIRIGAAVTHAEIEDGGAPEPIAGMLSTVARGIAYRAVRNRGTIGGSIAHADPAADWICLLVAAGARVHVRRSGGSRVIPMRAFMLGPYTTVLDACEIVTTVEIPKRSAGARWGYFKVCRKVGEFADAIGAAVVDSERRYCQVVLGASGGEPKLLPRTAFELARTAALPSQDVIDGEVGAFVPGAVGRRMFGAAVRRAIAQVVES